MANAERLGAISSPEPLRREQRKEKLHKAVYVAGWVAVIAVIGIAFGAEAALIPAAMWGISELQK